MTDQTYSSRSPPGAGSTKALSSAAALVRRRFAALFAESRRLYLNEAWGMDIGANCWISLWAKLDKTNPRGVHIGESTALDVRACILTHDQCRSLVADTWVGKECRIGMRSIIMPGVRIGDNCVVAPASVVLRDVPANCWVAGVPARIIEEGIKTGPLGVLSPRTGAEE
jgi:exopolysaccharide acyltransferase PssR